MGEVIRIAFDVVVLVACVAALVALTRCKWSPTDVPEDDCHD